MLGASNSLILQNYEEKLAFLDSSTFGNQIIGAYLAFWNPFTLTDLDSRSLLKTTPLLQEYPWVSGGQHVTPESRFSGLV